MTESSRPKSPAVPTRLKLFRMGPIAALAALPVAGLVVGTSTASAAPRSVPSPVAYSDSTTTVPASVPAGVCDVTFNVTGGQGGGTAGGLGGEVEVTLAVSAGESYQVAVGGAGGLLTAGQSGGVASGGVGGSGDTGNEAGGGGGASAVTVGAALTPTIIAAGGGGKVGGRLAHAPPPSPRLGRTKAGRRHSAGSPGSARPPNPARVGASLPQPMIDGAAFMGSIVVS